MTKIGLITAKIFGKKLLAFKNFEEAQKYYFSYRDSNVDLLSRISKGSAKFTMDFFPESLKAIENWYFDLIKENKFIEFGISREEFERCMGIYWGEVCVKNDSEVSWIVEEFAFESGKYEIGIKKGLCKWMLAGKCLDLYKKPNNALKQSLYREIKKVLK